MFSNYLHDTHIKSILRSGIDTICEKPVIEPMEHKYVREVQRETGKSIWTILQLGFHPK